MHHSAGNDQVASNNRYWIIYVQHRSSTLRLDDGNFFKNYDKVYLHEFFIVYNVDLHDNKAVKRSIWMHIIESYIQIFTHSSTKLTSTLRPEIQILKGTATLIWTMNFDTSIINIGWKMGKYGQHLAVILNILIRSSFQNFFNCLSFSYQYYHSICVLAAMQLYR